MSYSLRILYVSHIHRQSAVIMSYFRIITSHSCIAVIYSPSAVITEWRTVLCLHQTPGSKHNATLTVSLHVAIGGGPWVAPESSKSSRRLEAVM